MKENKFQVIEVLPSGQEWVKYTLAKTLEEAIRMASYLSDGEPMLVRHNGEIVFDSHA